MNSTFFYQSKICNANDFNTCILYVVGLVFSICLAFVSPICATSTQGHQSLQIATVKQIQAYPDSAEDRLDVLLLLDSSFMGEVGSANIADEKLTMISNTGLSAKWSKVFAHSPISKLEIIPHNNNLYINAKGRKRYYLKPSISKDKSTLRLSFYAADSKMLDSLLSTSTTLKASPIEEVFSDIKASSIVNKLSSISPLAQILPNSQNQTPSTQQQPFAYTAQNTNAQRTDIGLDSALQPKQNLATSQNPKINSDENFLGNFNLSSIAQGAEFGFNDYVLYLCVFAFVIVLLLLLRYIIRRSSNVNASLKVVSQSQIDSKNKVVIFETKEYFYMVLLGEKNNILIDKIPRGGAKPLTVGSVLESLGESKKTPSQIKPTAKTAIKPPLKPTPITSAQTPRVAPQATSPKPSPLESLTIGNENSFNQDFWDALKSGKR